MMKAIQECPCNSGSIFGKCCQPILKDHRQAKKPLQLMRSRYTAFVLEDEKFLLKTWAKKKRPKRLTFGKNIKWQNLKIHEVKGGNEGDIKGEVSFTATYIDNNKTITLSENSSFRKTRDLWYYVDGVHSTQESSEQL